MSSIKFALVIICLTAMFTSSRGDLESPTLLSFKEPPDPDPSLHALDTRTSTLPPDVSLDTLPPVATRPPHSEALDTTPPDNSTPDLRPLIIQPPDTQPPDAPPRDNTPPDISPQDTSTLDARPTETRPTETMPPNTPEAVNDATAAATEVSAFSSKPTSSSPVPLARKAPKKRKPKPKRKPKWKPKKKVPPPPPVIAVTTTAPPSTTATLTSTDEEEATPDSQYQRKTLPTETMQPKTPETVNDATAAATEVSTFSSRPTSSSPVQLARKAPKKPKRKPKWKPKKKVPPPPPVIIAVTPIATPSTTETTSTTASPSVPSTTVTWTSTDKDEATLGSQDQSTPEPEVETTADLQLAPGMTYPATSTTRTTTTTVSTARPGDFIVTALSVLSFFIASLVLMPLTTTISRIQGLRKKSPISTARNMLRLQGAVLLLGIMALIMETQVGPDYAKPVIRAYAGGLGIAWAFFVTLAFVTGILQLQLKRGITIFSFVTEYASDFAIGLAGIIEYRYELTQVKTPNGQVVLPFQMTGTSIVVLLGCYLSLQKMLGFFYKICDKSARVEPSCDFSCCQNLDPELGLAGLIPPPTSYEFDTKDIIVSPDEYFGPSSVDRPKTAAELVEFEHYCTAAVAYSRRVFDPSSRPKTAPGDLESYEAEYTDMLDLPPEFFRLRSVRPKTAPSRYYDYGTMQLAEVFGPVQSRRTTPENIGDA